MKYKPIQRSKPGDASAPKKWYASPVKTGTATQKTIAKEIAGRSSLTVGDVSNVLQNFVDVLLSASPKFVSLKLAKHL